MELERRSFVRGGVALAIAAAVPLPFVFSRRGAAAPLVALVPDPNGILDLPPGFTYKILEREGDNMDDGYRVAGAADAMACFPGPSNTLILMRNHEVGLNGVSLGPYKPGQTPPPQAYDGSAYGGVSRLVIDATTFDRISSNLVLVGTSRNCAGGVSPWGWLSCEESFAANHGYVFLCPTDASTVQPPRRIVGYGHFNHEAATVDPATNICYLTEDRGDSCLYRFLPNSFDLPFEGRLQALKVVGRSSYDTGAGMSVRERLDIEWVDVGDPDPVSDTLRTTAKARGAAVFRRGEGIWFHRGSVYICSTSGGPAGAGQIFRLTPDASHNGGKLELIVQSTSPDTLDMPDNITVAPWGGLFMAEDGRGTSYIRGLGPGGAVFDFARNAMSDSEFTGVCFSPDGKAMFVNIQNGSLTFAITGPFVETFTPPPVFADVPADHWARPWIETLYTAGATGGCGAIPLLYCPDAPVTREQMAVFLLRSKEGAAYTPPACATAPFRDVPCDSLFAPWIRELVKRGVTAGCGGGNYCPGAPVTRQEVAVFLLKALEGPAYAPPTCTAPPFADVPCSSPFAPWIATLVQRGITAGCSGTNYCPTGPVTRAQIAVFLVRTFTLPF